MRAREWHPTQVVTEAPAGGLHVTLDVCIDRALQSWILSFGPFARVVSPPRLARVIAEQIDEARAQYL
jgi:predicted DNA-binding transcriptional regulator YafY